FPAPEQLLAVTPEAMRACGFSASKTATVQGIAQARLEGLVPSRQEALAMADEVLIERLVALRGVGRWTVEMLLIYSLERSDILPVDDFA
ncbi:DNA-3-methyladenine glycosylase family protein, partial [Paraburkholderia sp. SIMBA_030]